MALESDNYPYSDTIRHHVQALREDYARVVGRPFKYFFCPLLLVDEAVPLCMGHIINQACPKSFRGRVPQRADVDRFYGRTFESDFTGNVQARSMNPREAILDPTICKKISPKIIVNGEEWKHYPDHGADVPGHTKVAMHLGGDEPLRWVVKKPQEEVDTLEKNSFQLAIGKDCRLSSLVSLIKAAYLTLFKLLGYSYALSTAGKQVGHELLGRFYREHGQKSANDARKEGLDFFRPYVNMMRTIEGFTGTVPLGTIESHRADVCTAAGKIFAILVRVRTNARYFDVLMPCFEEPEGQVIYKEFLHNDGQALRVHECKFENMTLTVSEESREIFWPKNDAEFNLE